MALLSSSAGTDSPQFLLFLAWQEKITVTEPIAATIIANKYRQIEKLMNKLKFQGMSNIHIWNTPVKTLKVCLEN